MFKNVVLQCKLDFTGIDFKFSWEVNPFYRWCHWLGWKELSGTQSVIVAEKAFPKFTSKSFTTCNSVLSGHFTSQLTRAAGPQSLRFPNGLLLGATSANLSGHFPKHRKNECTEIEAVSMWSVRIHCGASRLCVEYEKSCGRRGDQDLVKLRHLQRTVFLVTRYNVNIRVIRSWVCLSALGALWGNKRKIRKYTLPYHLLAMFLCLSLTQTHPADIFWFLLAPYSILLCSHLEMGQEDT